MIKWPVSIILISAILFVEIPFVLFFVLYVPSSSIIFPLLGCLIPDPLCFVLLMSLLPHFPSLILLPKINYNHVLLMKDS